VSAVTGFVGSAAFLFLSTRIPGAVPAMLVMGLAGFANDLVMPASWAASMDLGGRYAATVSALMNMVGCAGAGAFPIVTARILERSGQDWNAVLGVSALVYFSGALCWIVLDSVTPVAKETLA
jgi:hypothetical protein